jgi:hypothetical protein
MFRKVVAIVLCLSILNIGAVFASQPCLMCSDDMQEQMKEMGYEAEVTVEGMVVTNILTGEELTIITPEGSSQYCNALYFCMIFTFWVAFGIFFLPCYIAWAGSCT